MQSAILGVGRGGMIRPALWGLALALAAAPFAQAGEDWVRPPAPDVAQRIDWQSVELIRQHPVVSLQRSGAAALLQERLYVELKPKQAWLFAGQELDEIAGARAYLIRAISCASGIPGFDVQRAADGTLLWIKGAGAGVPQLQAYTPLIVLLNQSPGDVFITCAVVE